MEGSEGSLEDALRSIAEDERVFAWNWDWDGDEAFTVPSARSFESPATIPPSSADAVLSRMPFDTIDAATAESLHRALVNGGKLVVLDSDAEPLGGSARGAVRALSETGFALTTAPSRTRAGCLLVARRDPFTLRPYQRGDDLAIAALFRESFHVERAEAHFRWKYHENPWGNDFITLAVSPEGDLAAHYSGYAVPFWMEGREPLLALQMGDTMTGPRFRRIGRGATSLLARTVRYFFALHRPGPFAFYYGFNRGAIQRFCEWFIGGFEVDDVHYVEREGHDGQGEPEAGPSYDVRPVTREETQALDALFARSAPDYGFLVRRDARYVTWRYFDPPAPAAEVTLLGVYHRGRLVGWSVFSEREGELTWGDALFEREHRTAARGLLAAAAARAASRPLRIVGWFPPRPAWWSETLTELGFERKPEPQSLKLMVLADSVETSALQHLYYTKGDGDLF